jgi:hypothetical protein
LVAGFFAAFVAGDFFAATLFAVFFAAAFAIMIGPSRLIPSCETDPREGRATPTLTSLFFSEQVNARRSKGFRAVVHRIITRARQSTRSSLWRVAIPREAPRTTRTRLERWRRRFGFNEHASPQQPCFPGDYENPGIVAWLIAQRCARRASRHRKSPKARLVATSTSCRRT